MARQPAGRSLPRCRPLTCLAIGDRHSFPAGKMPVSRETMRDGKASLSIEPRALVSGRKHETEGQISKSATGKQASESASNRNKCVDTDNRGFSFGMAQQSDFL
jgi:hypothetical protein